MNAVSVKLSERSLARKLLLIKYPPILHSIRGQQLHKFIKMNINLLDWVYPKWDRTKAYSVREVIGNKLALTAPDYTRLYLGITDVEKIIDSYTLYELGNVEFN